MRFKSLKILQLRFIFKTGDIIGSGHDDADRDDSDSDDDGEYENVEDSDLKKYERSNSYGNFMGNHVDHSQAEKGDSCSILRELREYFTRMVTFTKTSIGLKWVEWKQPRFPLHHSLFDSDVQKIEGLLLKFNSNKYIIVEEIKYFSDRAPEENRLLIASRVMKMTFARKSFRRE